MYKSHLDSFSPDEFFRFLKKKAKMQITPNLLQEAFVWARRALKERGKPVPSEAFSGYVALCPQVVVDLVIADVVKPPFNGKVLLHYRGGRWNAWHTIGGFVFAGESVYDACKRHATDLGIEIEVMKEERLGGMMPGMIGNREDLTHPYGWDNNGHLFQNYFLCRTVLPIIETDEIRWFRKNEVPSPLLRGHEAHVEAYYNLK